MAFKFNPLTGQLDLVNPPGGGGSGAVDSVNGFTGVVVLSQDDVLDGTTNKQYSSTEKTKLAGIEAGADVTDTTNVTAAGALMDSEVADLTAIKTLLAPDNTTITAFGASLVDDADAQAARDTLSVPHFNIDPDLSFSTYGVQRLRHSTENFLTNSSFEFWNSGTTVAPDAWTLAGDVTILRNNTVSWRQNSYAAQLTFGTANTGELYQVVDSSTLVDYTFSCYVERTSGTGAARLVAQRADAPFTEFASVALPTNAGQNGVALTVKPASGAVLRFAIKSGNTTASTWVIDECMLQESKAIATTHQPRFLTDTYNGSFYANYDFWGVVNIGGTNVQSTLTSLVADTAVNNAKVTNATHTGEVTGSGALTVDKTAITNRSTVTAVGADYVLLSDTSDSGNLKKALVSDFAGVGGSGDVIGPGSATDNAIARFDTTTGKLLQDSVVTISDTGDITTTGATMLIDSSGSATSAIDRGASTDSASLAYRTAGTDQWAIGLQNDSTNRLYIRDSVNGVNLLQATQGATPAVTANGAWTFSSDVTVPDEAYGAGWNGDLSVPTKNAVYDKIEGINLDNIAAGTTNKHFTDTEKTKLAGIAVGATANSSDATLLNRANHTGTQTASTISDFSTAADARVAAAAGVSVASLSGGKVPTSQLPALSITDVYTVANQAAQLAVTAEEGDVAIRTDQNKSYVHNGGVAGTMADWSELLTPTDSVLSVNGETGAVTLTTDDISDTAQTNKWATAAEKAKLGHISVTQAVDLDAIETNANNVPGIKTKTDFITVTQAVDLDAIETNANNVPGIKTKTDFISVTQAVDLDTMESDIALKANDADVVHDTGNETIAGVKTFSSDPIIPDEVYGAGWNGSLEPPTKNAVYDKIESLGSGGVSDAAYDGSWNGDTSTAPSKNAVYDKLQAMVSGVESVSGTAGAVRIEDGVGGSGAIRVRRILAGSNVTVSVDGNGDIVVAASGGGGGVSDGDKGDITVSGSGATWTVDDLAISSSKLATAVSNEIDLVHTWLYNNAI